MTLPVFTTQVFENLQNVNSNNMNLFYLDKDEKLTSYFPNVPCIQSGIGTLVSNFGQSGTSNSFAISNGYIRFSDQATVLSTEVVSTVASITGSTVTVTASSSPPAQLYVVAVLTQIALDAYRVTNTAIISPTALTLAQIAAETNPLWYVPIFSITNTGGVYTIAVDSNCAFNYNFVSNGNSFPDIVDTISSGNVTIGNRVTGSTNIVQTACTHGFSRLETYMSNSGANTGYGISEMVISNGTVTASSVVGVDNNLNTYYSSTAYSTANSSRIGTISVTQDTNGYMDCALYAVNGVTNNTSSIQCNYNNATGSSTQKPQIVITCNDGSSDSATLQMTANTSANNYNGFITTLNTIFNNGYESMLSMAVNNTGAPYVSLNVQTTSGTINSGFNINYGYRPNLNGTLTGGGALSTQTSSVAILNDITGGTQAGSFTTLNATGNCGFATGLGGAGVVMTSSGSTHTGGYMTLYGEYPNTINGDTHPAYITNSAGLVQIALPYTQSVANGRAYMPTATSGNTTNTTAISIVGDITGGNLPGSFTTLNTSSTAVIGSTMSTYGTATFCTSTGGATVQCTSGNSTHPSDYLVLYGEQLLPSSANINGDTHPAIVAISGGSVALGFPYTQNVVNGRVYMPYAVSNNTSDANALAIIGDLPTVSYASSQLLETHVGSSGTNFTYTLSGIISVSFSSGVGNLPVNQIPSASNIRFAHCQVTGTGVGGTSVAEISWPGTAASGVNIYLNSSSSSTFTISYILKATSF